LQTALPEDWESSGFGLYLHWPFCDAKCPYCDFNSYAVRHIDHDIWRDAFLLEINRTAKSLLNRPLHSIYFGGGTPSLMEPRTVDAILDECALRFRFSPDIEISLEANPTSVEMNRFKSFKTAGINRISVGVQALDDIALQLLGRQHSAADAQAAIDIANTVFDRTTFDIIYSRQNQTVDDWEKELLLALSLVKDHLSVYQLTVEDGTVFGERHKTGRLAGLPDDDTAADMYALTQDICTDADLDAYEISNHARPGAESRHNLIYWRCGDYLGIGPGAHGRLTLNGSRFATEAPRQPDTWLMAAFNGSGEAVHVPLSRMEQAEEYLLMSLRLREGANLHRYQGLAGRPLDSDHIPELEIAGLLLRDSNRLTVTEHGRPILNTIIYELLNARDR